MDKSQASIDSIIERFNSEEFVDRADKKSHCITLWVPKEVKAKFDAIQRRSNRKFARVLVDILKVSIDRVDGEAG